MFDLVVVAGMTSTDSARRLAAEQQVNKENLDPEVDLKSESEPQQRSYKTVASNHRQN